MPRPQLDPARRIMRGLALAAALSAAACAGSPPQAPISNAGSGTASASELDRLAAAVLARLAAEDGIPDAGLLPKEGPVYVLTEIGDDASAERIRTLPSEPRQFVGKTRAELEAEATRTGERVAFIRLFSVRREGETAFVTLGADVLLPGGAPKLCCCHATDRYDRRGSRWTFTSRDSEICS